MIDFMPDWIEWFFLVSGIITWCGLLTAVVVAMCEQSADVD